MEYVELELVELPSFPKPPLPFAIDLTVTGKDYNGTSDTHDVYPTKESDSNG